MDAKHIEALERLRQSKVEEIDSASVRLVHVLGAASQVGAVEATAQADRIRAAREKMFQELAAIDAALELMRAEHG